MEHGLICQLEQRDGETVLVLYDAKRTEKSFKKETLFTELPGAIEESVQNKELMAQLGESILIRLAVSNGIKI